MSSAGPCWRRSRSTAWGSRARLLRWWRCCSPVAESAWFEGTETTVPASYQPGIEPADLHTCLPAYVTAALAEALPVFARRLEGFAMDTALLTGVETRTSSPVRLPRHSAGLESTNTPGLYPAGEGAGYAGGILSAAIDGIKVAEQVALALRTRP